MPIFTYATWTDFVEAAAKDAPRNGLASRRTGDRAWSGTHNFEEALKLAREGWPDGVEKTRGVMDQLDQALFTEVLRPQPKQDVTGQWFDPGLVAEGVPECCYEWSEVRQSGPAVKVVLSGAVSAGVSSQTIINRGAAVCAFIQALELAGRQSEVWLCMRTSGWEYQVCVKQADNPLQLDQLCYALQHPATFRRLCFSEMEHTGHPGAGGSYGYPENASMTGDIVLECGHLNQWQTVEQSKRHIEDWLKRYHYVEAQG